MSTTSEHPDHTVPVDETVQTTEQETDETTESTTAEQKADETTEPTMTEQEADESDNSAIIDQKAQPAEPAPVEQMFELTDSTPVESTESTESTDSAPVEQKNDTSTALVTADDGLNNIGKLLTEVSELLNDNLAEAEMSTLSTDVPVQPTTLSLFNTSGTPEFSETDKKPIDVEVIPDKKDTESKQEKEMTKYYLLTTYKDDFWRKYPYRSSGNNTITLKETDNSFLVSENGLMDFFKSPQGHVWIREVYIDNTVELGVCSGIPENCWCYRHTNYCEELEVVLGNKFSLLNPQTCWYLNLPVKPDLTNYGPELYQEVLTFDNNIVSKLQAGITTPEKQDNAVADMIKSLTTYFPSSLYPKISAFYSSSYYKLFPSTEEIVPYVVTQRRFLSQTFYKVTCKSENHNNYQYKTGMNVLTDTFNGNPHSDCVSGGLYFTTLHDVHNYYNFGVWLREVTLPFYSPSFKFVAGQSKDKKWQGNMIIFAPQKWRANMIIFGERFSLYSSLTYAYLNMPYYKQLTHEHVVLGEVTTLLGLKNSKHISDKKFTDEQKALKKRIDTDYAAIQYINNTSFYGDMSFVKYLAFGVIGTVGLVLGAKLFTRR